MYLFSLLCLFQREMGGQRAAGSLQSTPPLSVKQQQQNAERYKEQKIQNMVHMHNLKVSTVCGGVYVLMVEHISLYILVCVLFIHRDLHVWMHCSVCSGISRHGIQWCGNEGYV